MSWGNRKAAEPPRAFGNRQTSQIENCILQTARRVLHMYHHPFTGDELMQLFIDPADREHVRKAWLATAGNNVGQQGIYVKSDLAGELNGSAQLCLSWSWDPRFDGFFVPLLQGGRKETAVSVRPDAPPALAATFKNLIDDMVRTSYEWGVVMLVYRSLNQNGYCNTPAQMRYVWPAITPILNYAGMTDLAKELVTPSARSGDKARIPAHVQSYIKSSADTVTRSLLLDLPNMYATRHEYPHVNVVNPVFEVGPGRGFEGMN
jgi:hypothetical protein